MFKEDLLIDYKIQSYFKAEEKSTRIRREEQKNVLNCNLGGTLTKLELIFLVAECGVITDFPP